MSIINVAIKSGYPVGSSDVKSGTEWEIRYVCLSDSLTDGPMAVLAALPFTLGNVYSYEGETDPSALCQKISAPERIGPKQWEASCFFSPPERAQPSQNPENEPDPFARWPDVSWTQEKRQKPLFKALRLQADGTWELEAVVNSAGGPYAQPLMEDRDRRVLDLVRNERFFPAGHSDLFANKLNGNVFLGSPPLTVLCRFISGQWVAELVESVWLRYWRVHYQFVFDPDGFADEVLDAGAFYRDTRSSIGGNPNPDYGKLVAVRDKDGVPMTGPFLLDGSGGLLADDRVASGDVIYRTYLRHAAVDFSPMNIVIPY